MYKTGTLVKANVKQYLGKVGIVLESDELITTVMLENYKAHFFNEELEVIDVQPQS